MDLIARLWDDTPGWFAMAVIVLIVVFAAFWWHYFTEVCDSLGVIDDERDNAPLQIGVAETVSAWWSTLWRSICR